jgi:histidinol-phosphate/aromatic aminotransferase/cobyric acid decarboxylase-like protein
LDLCTGQNRFGAPQAVTHAAREALCSTQPHAISEAARNVLAERFGVTGSQVVLGAGANGLLWSVAQALVEPGCTWLSIEPSVTSFAAAARAAGARVTQWRAVERREHRVELDQVAELARLVQPKVISSSAPADPPGTSVPFASLCALAEQFADIHFVVDQSWLALSSDHTDLELLPPKNVICLRSLSVELALSGLRAGYLLAAPDIAQRVARVQPPLAASAAAAAALAAAVHERAYVERCRSQLQADAQHLKALLSDLQLTYSPSVTPFTLVRVARAEQVAQELLTQHQIAVYDATRVGLPDHLRIAAPGPESLGQLKTALERVLERRGLVRGREL